MSRLLALLSGKGGSGKTTLSLSISSLLSKCGVKVLLVDCDLCTNGATYFYENRLTDKSKQLDSFYKLFFEDGEFTSDRQAAILQGAQLNLVTIDDNMDFLPSITKASRESAEPSVYAPANFYRKMHNILAEKYEVVIFDCQAGYTSTLRAIVPFIDVGLVVMEADAISSSSVRSLLLKTGKVLTDKRVYQVFNKATEEEYNIYSKLSGGTVFTNIETVMFDWRIRNAFATAQIPDLENTSARYGEQVHGICKILLNEPSILEKLKVFDTLIEVNAIAEQERQLKEQNDKILKAHLAMKNKRYYMFALYILVVCLSALLSLVTAYYMEDVPYYIYAIMLAVALTTVFLFFLNSASRDSRMENAIMRSNTWQIEELERKKKHLQALLENKKENKEDGDDGISEIP